MKKYRIVLSAITTADVWGEDWDDAAKVAIERLRVREGASAKVQIKAVREIDSDHFPAITKEG